MKGFLKQNGQTSAREVLKTNSKYEDHDTVINEGPFWRNHISYHWSLRDCRDPLIVDLLSANSSSRLISIGPLGSCFPRVPSLVPSGLGPPWVFLNSL